MGLKTIKITLTTETQSNSYNNKNRIRTDTSITLCTLNPICLSTSTPNILPFITASLSNDIDIWGYMIVLLIQVSTDEGRNYAEGIGAIFHETSALTGKNVNELFHEIGKC